MLNVFVSCLQYLISNINYHVCIANMLVFFAKFLILALQFLLSDIYKVKIILMINKTAEYEKESSSNIFFNIVPQRI